MSAKNTIKVTLDINKKPPAFKGKTAWARLRTMKEAEVHANAVADVDNPPLTASKLSRLASIPNAREIRERLGLSQRAFATRFHLSLATVRDWEQGRFHPDQAARTLLRLIARQPELVARTLRSK